MTDDRLRELFNLVLYELAAAGAGRDGNERREVVTRRAIAADVLACIAFVAGDASAWPGSRMALKTAGVLVGTLDKQLAALKASGAPVGDLEVLLANLRALEAARDARRRAEADHARREAVRRSEEQAADMARRQQEEQARYLAAQAQEQARQLALARSKRNSRIVLGTVLAIGFIGMALLVSWCRSALDEAARSAPPTTTTTAAAVTATVSAPSIAPSAVKPPSRPTASARPPAASASGRKPVVLSR